MCVEKENLLPHLFCELQPKLKIAEPFFGDVVL